MSDYHIAVAHHVRRHTISTIHDVQHSHTQASGYGRSQLEAKVRAAYEAVERYSMTWQGTESRRRGTIAEMGQRAVRPNEVMLFSNSQFQQRAEINATLTSSAEYVPKPLRGNEAIDWVPGWCLTKDTVRWLPAALCYDGYPQVGEPYALADSNGVAAGPTHTFAIRQGLYELIERDLVSLFHYNRLTKRGVDVQSWCDPYLDRLLSLHEEKLGRSMAVLDLRPNRPGATVPFYWPLYGFVAVSWHAEDSTVVLGCGVHHTPEGGIQRALEECTQMLPNVLTSCCTASKQEKDMQRSHASTWDLGMQPHLRPDTSRPLLSRSDFPDEPSISSTWQLIEALADQGLTTIIQDLTRPETNIPVVRVLVPGLRPWWPRFAPGRLYEAPVIAGELEVALDEGSLNLKPITF